ncbi:hypothetical protein TL16_g02343 [Triparma laevis f. inornata]|uniref:Serine aminopeptidase S33 domain-containing protein n=1 Tax=Triparma laevis f. inornata TaxID=1714386 RepID=A0A9W6ZVK1_9STRA|nr:hypothetical protein TL16_g02343 [Triparma laevis f. inornata]
MSRNSTKVAPEESAPPRRSAAELEIACSPFVEKPNNEDVFWLQVPDGGIRNVIVWSPADAHKGIIVLLHGYGGNATRWQHLGEKYNAKGFKVYAMDQYGHGENPSNKKAAGMVGVTIDGMAADAVALCELVQELHPNTPWFLHGRSMGGLIAIQATLTIQASPNFKGSIFCAPAVRVCGKGLVPPGCADWKLFRGLTNLVSAVSCGYWPNPAAVTKELSVEKAVQIKCKKDPRMFGDMIRAGFGKELFRAQDVLIPKLGTLTAPFWLGHGSGDTIVPLRSSELVWKGVGTSEGDRVFKKYEGLRHEIMNEPIREQVIGDIISWFEDAAFMEEQRVLPPGSLEEDEGARLLTLQNMTIGGPAGGNAGADDINGIETH